MPKLIPILLLPLVFILGQVHPAFATHNRAGEISVRPIGPCTSWTVEATITTYTKASSAAADRDTLTICWGDGNCEKVGRVNGGGFGVLLPNDTKLNLYIATHQYSGPATYEISMTDPNRNGGILNVNWPNSETVKFHLQTNYTFPNCQFDGPNNTPTLEQPPIDIGCVGQPFKHNPNAVDIDGDSISYKLIVPLQDVDAPVPNYLWPDEVEPGGDNQYDLNELNGDFIWTNPQKAGEYNIAMYIISWRNGVAIDTVLRDMQILIETCEDNRPPIVTTQDFICVVAGETVQFSVSATDPDAGQQVELTALGGPFLVSVNPATFSAPTGYQNPPVAGTFTWNTTCEHISNQPYTVIFKAIDNYFGNFGLAALKTVQIKVVAPAPEDVQAQPRSDEIDISWENPYVCEDADDDYFYTFSVWRREGPNEFTIDNCEPGLDGKGYTRIAANTRNIVNGRYQFTDINVERGRTYCYRVLAIFGKLTDINPPQRFNIVESLPSNEICVQLSRDVPLMTNVDVETTSNTAGEIFVRWTKPLAADLDTLDHFGPYTYEVLRADGITNTGFQPIGVSFTVDNFWEANDTMFTDTGLDTRSSAYTYQIAFYVRGESEPYGFSNYASSVFLNIASTDETNNLSWDFDVPWNNTKYKVFRRNGVSFDLIGEPTEPFYSDQGLVNGREYCYYIESEGDYGIENIAGPLFNKSQENCGIPLDTIPPCPPELKVSNICDQAISCLEAELTNDLSWINPMDLCPETDDVVSYRIYYAAFENSPFTLIDSILISDETSYVHRPDLGIAGCYAVTALDTFYNESAFSNIICVDNCPIYELPNTFTPNGDNQNDLFIPYPYCFIETVEFQVFNRWGEMVFETNDPDLNWNGNNLRGSALPDGAYYYTCKIFEQRVAGITERPDFLSGYIELIRSR